METDVVVFFVSAGAILAFVVVGAVFSEAPEDAFIAIEELVSTTLNWWYIGLVTGLLSIAAMVAVFVFFVTSSDSGSLVIEMMTSGGHPEPPRGQRVFWAVTEGGSPRRSWSPGASTRSSPPR